MELDEIIQRSIVTQTLENESRQLKIKKLKDAVSALGFNVVQNVPYDGNCFFHAVGLLCGKDEHLFREETVRFKEQEMLNDSNSFYDESLIRILQAPNEDVQDNRVCKAIADMTGRVVVVLTLFNDERPITPETIYPTNGNKEDPCIYIGHIEDSHFVPIRGMN
ncbi:OTUB2 [Mytilus edulis]|uniref:OTUB2 n=1 Tax=Mytilus edulis TaxID=6550 RepID=A0A8S3UQC1_MYTED|nr:OTUB2 [Mytilus edulis]